MEDTDPGWGTAPVTGRGTLPAAPSPGTFPQVANPGAVNAYLALLRAARRDVALRQGLPLLCAALEASVGNRMACAAAGTNFALLSWLPRANPELHAGLLRALRASARHSLPVADLRAALGLLRSGSEGRLGPHHDGLLRMLGEVAADPTPPAFLHFDPGVAEPGPQESDAAGRAGLECAAPRAGPLLRAGLSLSVWLRWEAGSGGDQRPPGDDQGPGEGLQSLGSKTRPADAPQAQGTLVWVEEAQGRGLAVAADFAATTLWVHTWSPAHAALALDLGRGVRAGEWHHLCLALAPGGALSHASATLWVDSQLQVRHPGLDRRRGNWSAGTFGVRAVPRQCPACDAQSTHTR